MVKKFCLPALSCISLSVYRERVSVTNLIAHNYSIKEWQGKYKNILGQNILGQNIDGKSKFDIRPKSQRSHKTFCKTVVAFES